MNYYQDFKVKPNKKRNTPSLMSSLYANFHLALVKGAFTNIGVSFPNVGENIGNIIRIHGTEENLKFLGSKWIHNAISDCVIVGDITLVPEEHDQRNIRRHKPKFSNARLRRLIKRGTIDAAGIQNYRRKMFTEQVELPFLDVWSESSKNLYRTFFDISEPKKSPASGEFNSFGLSESATVPWF